MGIDYYDTPPVIPHKTLSEILAAMTNEQKLAVLNAFAFRPEARTAMWVKHNEGVPQFVTSWMYRKMEEIQTGMKKVMTGNWKGVTIPANATELKNFIKANYSSASTGDPDDFNNGQCDAIATKMVVESKYLGGADFAWYSDNVIFP